MKKNFSISDTWIGFLRVHTRSKFLAILLSLPMISTVMAGPHFTEIGVTPWPRPYPHYPKYGDGVYQTAPRVAWNGNMFLLVWYEKYNVDEWSYARVTYGSRLSDSGQLLDPAGILIGPDGGGYNDYIEPAVCAVGDDFWVFYGSYGYTEYIRGRVVHPSGNVNITQMNIGQGNGWASVTSLSAAYMPGKNILVAWRCVDPDGVYYSLVSPTSGAVIINSQPLVQEAISDHIVVSSLDSTFLVTYHGAGGLKSIRVAEDGSKIDTSPIQLGVSCGGSGRRIFFR